MKLGALSAVPLVVGAALWICAASASATIVTGPKEEIYTGTIKAESEGSTTLHGIIDVTCGKSTMEGAVESHGPEVTVKAPSAA